MIEDRADDPDAAEVCRSSWDRALVRQERARYLATILWAELNATTRGPDKGDLPRDGGQQEPEAVDHDRRGSFGQAAQE